MTVMVSYLKSRGVDRVLEDSSGNAGASLSAYAAVLSAGAVTGLVLGGVVVTADLFGTGWRPVFLVNVPIGLVLLYLAHRREATADDKRDQPVVAPSRVQQRNGVVEIAIGSADAARIGLETAALTAISQAPEERLTGEVVSEPEPKNAPSFASRSATKMYRSTPLRGLWQHAP